MVGTCSIRGISASLRVLGLVAFGVSVVALTGCQNGASNEKAVTSQAQTEAVRTAQRQAGESAGLDANSPLAKITVETPVVDLGEIGTDSKVSGKFTFTSSGQGPLRIVKTHTCCGVVIRGVEDGQVYRSGERGTLEFDWVTGSMPESSAEKVIRLQTSDPDQKFVSLIIKANVVHRLEVNPTKLSLFLRRENAACGEITVRSLDGKPFSIVSFQATGDSMSAAFDPNAQATEFVIQPRVDLEKLESSVRGVIRIDLSHPECGNVRVGYDVLPEFTISPALLMELALRPGQPIQKDVYVTNNYGDEFEIESVSSQKGYIRLVEQKKVDTHCELRIEIVPPPRTLEKAAVEGQDATTATEPSESILVSDTLEVKIKNGRTLSIPLRGFYVAEPM